MAFYPYRKEAAKWLQTFVVQSRRDLSLPALRWYVSQQPPPDQKSVNSIDITSNIAAIASNDPALIHIKAFNLPLQEEKLVLNTAGVIHIGKLLAQSYLDHP
jgi:hypothetical protein